MAAGSEATDEEALHIQVLGGFRVAVGRRELDERDWGLRKASALVKLLAITPGHRLHRERVMDALWPELALSAGNNSLHRTLHVARRALQPNRSTGAATRYLTLRGDVLSLGPTGAAVVDADAFREAVAAAQQARDAAAYQRAIALYGGDLLPDDLYDDWTVAARESLHEMYVALLAEAARHFATQHAPDEAVETLRRLVAVEPTREDAYVALMRLLARGGRRYDALRQYQHLRAVLRDELDAEPDITTQQLYQEIQSGTFPPVKVTTDAEAAARDAGAEAGAAAWAPAVGTASRTGSTPASEPRALSPAGAANSTAGPQPAETLSLARPRALASHATSFVGRVSEREELSGLLASRRLVTVVGPGGCGKTRLALHTAESLRHLHADGVSVVELGSLDDPALVPQAVALALGIREQADRPLAETLAATLAPLELLLVLDNCEHLRDACAQVVRPLLQACPHLRILATSRRPLGLSAETVWRLYPLATPDPDALPSFVRLLDYDAIRLFVERAVTSRPGFTLTAQNGAAVVRICHRLDGLPLAIELAAGRRQVLTIEQIAARLDDALALLGGGPDEVPRQATLRATIAWSWNLSPQPERVLLRRLAVFAGGWTLEAAEAICSGDELDRAEVLNLLARLVERSLVVVVEREETLRYRLLDTIRQFAAMQLRAAGEEETLRERHARWILEFVTTAEAGLHGSEQSLWLAQLDAENDNLRAALEWACGAGEVELAGRIAGPAARYWHLRGTLREGRLWLERTLALNDSLGRIAPIAVRARTLQEIGLLAQFQTDLAAATAACEESLRLWRELGNPRGIDESLSVLGGVAESRGDYQRAAQIYGECLDLAREQGDLSRETLGLSNVADQYVLMGDLARAKDLYTESLALARRTGNRRHQAMALTNLGKIALSQGDATSAETSLEAALETMRALGVPRGAGEALLPLGELALAGGDIGGAVARYREALGEYSRSDAWMGVAQALEGLSRALTADQQGEHAARLLGAAEALRERLGTPRSPAEEARHQQDATALRTLLGNESLAGALMAGRELPIEQVVAALRAESIPTSDLDEMPRAAAISERAVARSPRRTVQSATLPLTSREREIAELVAAGLTNRDIAERLHIAPRTVDTHVANLLAKLDLRSRAEVGPWLRANAGAE